MKILDRVLLSVATLGVGIGCALGVTHVDDVVQADAYADPEIASVSGLAGTCWLFSQPPDDPRGDGVTFPAVPFIYGSVMLYAVNCYFEIFWGDGNYENSRYIDGFSYHFVGYQNPLNGWYYYTTDSIDEDFPIFSYDYPTYIYFQSDIVRSPKEAPVWSNGNITDLFIDWLSAYATLVQTPNGKNGDVGRGIRFGSDYMQLNFFDLDFARYQQQGFKGIYDIDPAAYQYPNGATERFKYIDNTSIVPYAVSFRYDEDGFLNVTDLILVQLPGNLLDNPGDLFFPYCLLCLNNYVYVAGSADLVVRDPWYGPYPALSGTNVPMAMYDYDTQLALPDYITMNVTSLWDFFGRSFSYAGHASKYNYLERISYLFADAFAYSNYFMMSNGEYQNWIVYDDGYQAGKIDGYSDGYVTGRTDGYDEGKRVGFTEGQASVTEESTAIMNLFGAVVSVPIGVLNGLSPLAIWNTPIIAIIVTFLFMGVVFMILKKVL